MILHDFITEKQRTVFNDIIEDLGFIAVFNTKSKFKKIIITDNAPATIKRNPNTVLKSFEIVETHESAQYSSNHVLIKDCSSNAHYYAENLEHRVADCSIGHKSKILLKMSNVYLLILLRMYQ